MQSTCFQAFAFQLRSNEFHEKLLKVSIRVLTGATKLSPSHCFLIQKQRIPWNFSEFLFVYWQVQPKCFQIIVYELKAMNSLNLLEVSKLLLFVSWQLQSKCFQVLASQLKSNEFLTPLKLSIRVLAGAIRMLPNHCFSMEKQWIPWSFSKFLFV